MDEIYQNAFLIISATNAFSARSGFLNHKYGDIASHRVPLLYPDELTGYIFIREKSWYPEEPLDKRAWALQERFLSRRLLDYTSIGLTKTCREQILRDEPRPEMGRDLFHIDIAKILDDRSDRDAEFDRAEILSAWDRTLGLYTARLLTDQKDRLPALGGLVKQFHKYLGCDYVAGLWRDYIPQGLLWYGNNTFTKVVFRKELAVVRRVAQYRAPSWSWASVEGPLSSENGGTFDQGFDESSEKIEITLRVLQCIVELANPNLPFGQVTGGILQVNGHVRDVICQPSSIRQEELEVGGIRLTIKPDDFGEWSDAQKAATTISLLEIVRRSEEAGSVLNETTLFNFWQGSDAVFSTGLMLVRAPSDGGYRYRRLGYFKEIEAERRKYLFEKCERRTIVIE